MDVQISLDELTQYSVSVVKRQYLEIDGVKYFVGNPNRTAYVNSISGRADIAAELSEPYLSAVMAVWGGTPLMPEPEIENRAEE